MQRHGWMPRYRTRAALASKSVVVGSSERDRDFHQKSRTAVDPKALGAGFFKGTNRPGREYSDSSTEILKLLKIRGGADP